MQGQWRGLSRLRLPIDRPPTRWQLGGGPIAFEPATYEKRPKLSSLMTKLTELQNSS